MGLYFHRTPEVLKKVYPKNVCWNFPNESKSIFLTFDDGPTPEVTDYVLSLLDQYKAKATFFVIGKQVDDHPMLFKRLLAGGHSVGNHTFHHINGWRQGVGGYVSDIIKSQKILVKHGMDEENFLFRPPYGKLTFGQARELINQYQIVMWQIMLGDFDASLNIEKAWRFVRETKPGDILLFHDTKKAFDNLKVLLPKTLDYFAALGYTFKAIGR